MTFLPFDEFSTTSEKLRLAKTEAERGRRLERIREATTAKVERERPNARRPTVVAEVERVRLATLARQERRRESIAGKTTADEPVPPSPVLWDPDAPEEVCAAELAARVRVMLEGGSITSRD